MPDSSVENCTFSKLSDWPKVHHLPSSITFLLIETWFLSDFMLKWKVPDSPVENGTFSKLSDWPKVHHLSSWATLLLTPSRFEASVMSYEFLASDGRTHGRTRIEEKKIKISIWHISTPYQQIFKFEYLKFLDGPKRLDGMCHTSFGPLELRQWPRFCRGSLLKSISNTKRARPSAAP